VSGASAYLSWPGGLEIEVDTCPGQEGKGYATLAAAAMVLECHRRGLKASWDADNPASRAIAEKIGFTCLGEYEICRILRR
jgi:predicted GNAT family acetyltransferase